MTTSNVTGAAGELVPITRVERVTWQPDDERALLVGATIIGRARIHVAGGGLLHGLVVSRMTVDEPYDPRATVPREVKVVRYVVWWDRYTSRFVATELDEVQP